MTINNNKFVISRSKEKVHFLLPDKPNNFQRTTIGWISQPNPKGLECHYGFGAVGIAMTLMM